MSDDHPPARLGRAYQKVLAASAISSLGDGVDAAAFPLFTAALTKDPRLVALTGTAATLPWLGFSLVAGALVDRWDRRRVMVIVNAIRAVLVGAVAVIAGSHHGHIWMLLLVFLALGVCETFFDNAAQSLLPAVVVPELLEKANGRQGVAQQLGQQFVGPPVGALLFSIAIAVPFGIDAGSFALSAVLIASLGGSFRPKPLADAPLAARSIRREIGEGLRWLRGHRLLRTLAIELGIMNLCTQLGFAILVLFARQKLHVGTRTFGFLLAGFAVGGLLGGMLGARLSKRLGPGAALRMSMIATGGSMLLIGLQSNWLVVVALSVITGTFEVIWNVITVSLRQQVIPDHLFGRVNSAYRFLGWGGMPIGATLGGLIANAFGLRAPFIIAGVVCLVAVLPAFRIVTTANVEAARAAVPRRDVAHG